MHKIDHNAAPAIWGERKYPKNAVVQLDPELYEALKAYCDKRRIKVSQYLRFLIAENVLSGED